MVLLKKKTRIVARASAAAANIVFQIKIDEILLDTMGGETESARRWRRQTAEGVIIIYVDETRIYFDLIILRWDSSFFRLFLLSIFKLVENMQP